MTMKQRIAAKFQSHRQSRTSVGEDWQITLAEWYEHFADPKLRDLLFEVPAQKRLARVNAVEPWTLDNLVIVDKPKPPPPTPRPAARMKSDHPGWTVLSVDQWLAELRENRPSD